MLNIFFYLIVTIKIHVASKRTKDILYIYGNKKRDMQMISCGREHPVLITNHIDDDW